MSELCKGQFYEALNQKHLTGDVSWYLSRGVYKIQ